MYILPHFGNIILSASSACGKTSFAKQTLLEASRLFKIPPTKYMWVYKIMDDNLSELQSKLENFHLFPTLPSNIEELTYNEAHTILVIDDVCLDLSTNSDYVKLMCYHSHHNKVTVIISTQDLGGRGKYASLLQKNAHCWILLSSCKAISALLSIAKHMGNYKFLKAVYNDISQSGPYKHLIINCHPQIQHEHLRFVSNIFKTDTDPLTLYVRRNS